MRPNVACTVPLRLAAGRGTSAPCCGRSTARAASTFAYLKPGSSPKLVHELTFDEKHRHEQWKSDTIPRVQPASWSGPSTFQLQAEYEEMLALVKEHPDTFLVRAMKANAERNGDPLPLTDEELVPYLSPATDEEKQALSTFHGRVVAAENAQLQIKEVVHLLRAAEAREVDMGVYDASTPYSASQKQQVTRLAHLTTAKAGMKLLRSLSILQAAHLNADGPEARAAGEKAWLSRVGVCDPASPGARALRERSPRIPIDMWLAVDLPLDTPQAPEEIRDGAAYLSYEQQKLAVMEHRDRSEAFSRTALPPSLSSGAPNADLAAAARALESNASLTRQDREYMLQFYADALAEKPSAFDLSAETAAYADPQPQWSVYDPFLARIQDDASDALAGRGRFSAYRGNIAESEMTPPSMIGEASLPGVGPSQHGERTSSGRAPEVVEEAEAILRSMAARTAAEGAMASAAVTAALEKAMGLRPRKAGSGASSVLPSSVTGPSFWTQYATGARMAGPVPPPKGQYSEPLRAPMEAGGREGDKKADKGDAKGGKGGKAGAPASGSKAAPAPKKK